MRDGGYTPRRDCGRMVTVVASSVSCRCWWRSYRRDLGGMCWRIWGSPSRRLGLLPRGRVVEGSGSMVLVVGGGRAFLDKCPDAKSRKPRKEASGDREERLKCHA